MSVSLNDLLRLQREQARAPSTSTSMSLTYRPDTPPPEVFRQQADPSDYQPTHLRAQDVDPYSPRSTAGAMETLGGLVGDAYQQYLAPTVDDLFSRTSARVKSAIYGEPDQPTLLGRALTAAEPHARSLAESFLSGGSEAFGVPGAAGLGVAGALKRSRGGAVRRGARLPSALEPGGARVPKGYLPGGRPYYEPTFYTEKEVLLPTTGKKKVVDRSVLSQASARATADELADQRLVANAPLLRAVRQPETQALYHEVQAGMAEVQRLAESGNISQSEKLHAQIKARVDAYQHRPVPGLGEPARPLSAPAKERLYTPRIPIDPKAARVDPGILWTPGQPTAKEIMGETRFKEALAGATYEPGASAYHQGQAQRKADEMRLKLTPPEALDPSWERGQFGSTWYVGSYPEEQSLVARLQRVADPRTRIDYRRDPEILTWGGAATSPQTEPYLNEAYNTAAYGKFLRANRDVDRIERATARGDLRLGLIHPATEEAWMQGHRDNMLRALKGEPLSGLKVSNYGLNRLGYEPGFTGDRWAIADVMGIPTTSAAPTPLEYKVGAEHMGTLGERLGEPTSRAQAGYWTGSKLNRDPRMADLVAQGFTDEQVVTALREVRRYTMEDLIRAVAKDPRKLTPLGAAAAALLLERQREGTTPPS